MVNIEGSSSFYEGNMSILGDRTLRIITTLFLEGKIQAIKQLREWVPRTMLLEAKTLVDVVIEKCDQGLYNNAVIHIERFLENHMEFDGIVVSGGERDEICNLVINAYRVWLYNGRQNAILSSGIPTHAEIRRLQQEIQRFQQKIGGLSESLELRLTEIREYRERLADCESTIVNQAIRITKLLDKE